MSQTSIEIPSSGEITRKPGRVTVTKRIRPSDILLQQITEIIHDFRDLAKERRQGDRRFYELVRKSLDGKVWRNLKEPLTSWEEFCEKHLGFSRIRGIQIANQAKMTLAAETTLGKRGLFIKDKLVRAIAVADQKRVLEAAKTSMTEDGKNAQLALDEAVSSYINAKSKHTKAKKKRNSDSMASAQSAATDDDRAAEEERDENENQDPEASNRNSEAARVTAQTIIEAGRDLKSLLDGFDGEMSQSEKETVANEFPAVIEALTKLLGGSV